MTAAIETLERDLETCETNEPIHRVEGRVDQAELTAARAAEIRQALAVLRPAVAGPISAASRN